MTGAGGAFGRTVASVHGPAGERWLERLPELLGACERRWHLTIGPPFELSYNHVAPARRSDGSEVVLKVGVPCPELSAEIAALRLFRGRGAALLLDADARAGCMLLERLEPGTPLTAVADDEEATRIAAGVIQRLWRPPPADHAFPSVADWVGGFARLRERFSGGTGPLPARIVAEAEARMGDMLAGAGELVVLHGDAHHGNILRSHRDGWLAIDPKGVAGEAAFEAGAFLLNPGPLPAPALSRRIAIFANAWGIDAERIRAWGIGYAVLSAWWHVEDEDGDWEPAILVAERLLSLG